MQAVNRLSSLLQSPQSLHSDSESSAQEPNTPTIKETELYVRSSAAVTSLLDIDQIDAHINADTDPSKDLGDSHNAVDFTLLDQFESFATTNLKEIAVLATYNHISYSDRMQWRVKFDKFWRQSRIDSLACVFADKKLNRYLFGNNQCYGFVKKNLVPLIVEFENAPKDLLKRIQKLYNLRLENVMRQSYVSIFNVLGWIECILFTILGAFTIWIHFLQWPSFFDSFQTIVAILCIGALIVHLCAALFVFHRRRNYCFHLVSLCSDIDLSHFTPFIVEGFNIVNIQCLRDPTLESSFIKPESITIRQIIQLSAKYLLPIMWPLGILQPYVAISYLILCPVICAGLTNADSIYGRIADTPSHYYQFSPSRHRNRNPNRNRNRDNDNVNESDNDDGNDYPIIESNIITDDSDSNEVESGFSHSRFWCDMCGCFCLFLCLWPAAMLTPFAFGIAIMCEVDLGLEAHWPLKEFLIYWSAFMSIKVTIGLILVIICDIVWPQPNELRPNDSFNGICFASMCFVSSIVLISLFFGMESLPTAIVRLCAWMAIYVWIQASLVRELAAKTQPTFQWRHFIKFQWFTSNLLQSV